MWLRSAITNKHQRLSLLCMGWALLQLAVGLLFKFSAPIGFGVLGISAITTATLWVSLPIVRRRTENRVVSTKFYILTRVALLVSFGLWFLCPVISWVSRHDRFQFVVVVFLATFAFFSALLAASLYGKSLIDYMHRRTDARGVVRT